MSVVEINRTIKAHANVVWKVITNFDHYNEILPDITRVERISGDGLGLIQRLHHKSGRTWEEKCIEWNENSGYTMQVNVRGYPLPVTKMRRTFTLEEGPKNVLIKLKYKYTPKYGPFGFFLNKHHIKPILKMYSQRMLDNLAERIHDSELGFHVSAATILKKKGMEIISIRPEMKIIEASRLLTEKKIGCTVVLNSDQSLAGILSERDVVHAISRHGIEILEQPVTKIMTHDVITCKPEDDLKTLMSSMTDRRIRHLPVMDGDRIVGVISIGDIVKARMDELETESAALHNYIKGRRWRELSMQIGRKGAFDEIDTLNAVISDKT